MRVDDKLKLGGHGSSEAGKLPFDQRGRTIAHSACTLAWQVPRHDSSPVVATVYMNEGLYGVRQLLRTIELQVSLRIYITYKPSVVLLVIL